MSVPVMYLRLSLITGFAIFAMFCVSYAHSQSLNDSDIETYRGWGCHLQVKYLQNGAVKVKVSASRTWFDAIINGNYIYAESGKNPVQYIGVEASPANETLSMWWKKKADGKYEPVRYWYVPNQMNAQRRHLNFDEKCSF